MPSETEGITGMSKYSDIANALHESLKLEFPPIAVCLAKEIPRGIPEPARPAAAGCRFWQEAAGGPVATSSRHHELCSIGVYTHNLADAPASCASELGDVLKVMADMTYVRPEDIAHIPVLRQQAKHVIYAPLAQTPLDPDVVLLFASSRQGLVIAEAVNQEDPGVPPALGRPACAVVPQVVNTGSAALSLGCCGARAYLDVLTDDIALWALPGTKLARYAERIAALSGANEVLGRFHVQRRRDVEAGLRPTFRESLGRA
jgi:uncharacterized protein (DUF169 family)